MKNMAVYLVAIIIGGMAAHSQAFGGTNLMFLNKSRSTIQINVKVGFWCKDHRSGEIPPDGTWACDTNCGYEAKIRVNSHTPSGNMEVMSFPFPPWAACGGDRHLIEISYDPKDVFWNSVWKCQ